MSNGTSVIKEIRLQNLTPDGVSPFKVIQGHRNRHESIGCLRLPVNVP